MNRNRTLLLGCAALTILGCNQSSETQTESPQTAATSTVAQEPAPPAALRRIEVTEEKAAAGKAHFAMCAGCHGPDAGGKIGQAPRLIAPSFLAAASDDFLFQTIKNGRPGTTMIPWGGTLKDDDIESVIAYLRTLEPAPAAAIDESPLRGDTEQGAKLFSEICAACHGPHGAGYQETANGTGIGREGFLSTATNGYIRYVAHHGKEGTAMKPMQGAKTAVANLTDEEIDSIIKYLRKSAW